MPASKDFVASPLTQEISFRLPFLVATATLVGCASSFTVARILALVFHLSPFWMMRTFYQLVYRPAPPPPPAKGARHVFLIPSYMEPATVLRKTLRRLASHRAAREAYVVVLAMEARELVRDEGKLKRDSLLEEFGDSTFLKIAHSEHHLLPGEIASKCSNVAAALRFVRQLGLDSEQARRRHRHGSFAALLPASAQSSACI